MFDYRGHPSYLVNAPLVLFSEVLTTAITSWIIFDPPASNPAVRRTSTTNNQLCCISPVGSLTREAKTRMPARLIKTPEHMLTTETYLPVKALYTESSSSAFCFAFLVEALLDC